MNRNQIELFNSIKPLMNLLALLSLRHLLVSQLHSLVQLWFSIQSKQGKLLFSPTDTTADSIQTSKQRLKQDKMNETLQEGESQSITKKRE